MKILIVYATAGAGHKKAAEAVYQAAKQKKLDVKIIDILDYANPFFKYLYSCGYIFLIKNFSFLWRLIFYITHHSRSTLIRKIIAFFDSLNCGRYFDFLRQERFDLVISTHFMSTEMTSRLKDDLAMRLVNVVTDYGVHRLWLNLKTDKYLVASNFTRDILVSYGIAENIISVTGIPIDSKFSQNYDRVELSEKLGVSNNLFTILIMTGAIGMGPIREIIEALKNDNQLLVVCGSNKRLYAQLENISSPNLKLFALVDNVYELMSVSDLIITKPGGMSVSESLTKSLPMIFFSIIPGQELVNAEIIQESGAGIILKDAGKIKDLVAEFRNNKEKLLNFKNNAGSLSHPDAAVKILDVSLANPAS
ncbi:MAG: hypothetical protein COV72_03270 [Candidatus Omnitrophica bacterium CG11_big_fil_rev_8_21_14_0_20_42_13]|uniref:Galactosyldiacylglycerol synthase n=1 Tax=Candidatus Ghiorseimicrobium undicola TaxID=1974746 RepID=A0A2H0M0X2_9BACT|nr:MAG: hypothetical protein COV72_03270 [Candidatus Omnitrophica bacterium CG11_big_fil_rev_8_21_14_0_20_42_13]